MFPTFPLREQRLLATYSYNIDAKLDSGYTPAEIKSAGYHVDGASIGGLRSTDRLIVRVKTDGSFDGWSPWGLPNYVPGNDDSGSLWQFLFVRPDDSFELINYFMGLQDGYLAARAIAIANQPWVVTGDDEYWIGIRDTPVADNTGGVSVTIEVWGGR